MIITDGDTSKMEVDAFLRRQEEERADLAAHILEEQQAPNRLRSAFNLENGRALSAVLDEIDHQPSADLRTGSIQARTVTELPILAEATFRRLDADKRQRLVCLPTQSGDGHTEKLASTDVDVTNVMFSSGSRRP